MLEFDMIQCGLIVLCLMVAGEVISHRMQAIIPAILASALLYLALLWANILPPTLIQDSGLTHLTTISMMFTIVGMGASTNPKDLLENWRVVVLASISYIGQTLITLLVISTLFHRNMAIGSLPGGAAVALIVQERAKELGYEQIVLLSVLLVAVQSLISCPLVSIMLRKEVVRFQKSGIHFPRQKETKSSADVNTRRESPYWALLRFFITAWIASRLEFFTGISKYVFCLILGVFLTKLGFLHRDEMDRSKSRGLLSLMMMTMILDGFSAATPDMFAELLLPLVCVFSVEVISIFILSTLFGRFFGFSREMSFSICLNVMIGFPLNLMLAQDIIDFLVENPDEKKVMNQQISTKMVIGGFTSVTFLSTVVAGLLVGFMH